MHTIETHFASHIHTENAAESLKLVLLIKMDADVVTSAAAHCQTGEDNREDTVMDLTLREVEGGKAGMIETGIERQKGGGDKTEAELG